jgi:hypothetical protein
VHAIASLTIPCYDPADGEDQEKGDTGKQQRADRDTDHRIPVCPGLHLFGLQ